MENIAIGVRGQLRTFFVDFRYKSFLDLIKCLQEMDLNVVLFFNIEKKSFHGYSLDNKSIERDWHFKNFMKTWNCKTEEEAIYLISERVNKLNELNKNFEERIKEMPCEYIVNYSDSKKIIKKNNLHKKGFTAHRYQFHTKSHSFQMLLDYQQQKNINFTNFISCRADSLFNDRFLSCLKEKVLSFSKNYYVWDTFRMFSFPAAFELFSKSKNKIDEAYDDLDLSYRVKYTKETGLPWNTAPYKLKVKFNSLVHLCDINFLKTLHIEVVKCPVFIDFLRMIPHEPKHKDWLDSI